MSKASWEVANLTERKNQKKNYIVSKNKIGAIGLVEVQTGGRLRHLVNSISDNVVYLSPFILIAMCVESGEGI